MSSQKCLGVAKRSRPGCAALCVQEAYTSFRSAAPVGLISLEETLMNSIIYLVGLVVVVLFVLSLLGLR